MKSRTGEKIRLPGNWNLVASKGDMEGVAGWVQFATATEVGWRWQLARCYDCRPLPSSKRLAGTRMSWSSWLIRMEGSEDVSSGWPNVSIVQQELLKRA